MHVGRLAIFSISMCLIGAVMATIRLSATGKLDWVFFFAHGTLVLVTIGYINALRTDDFGRILK